MKKKIILLLIILLSFITTNVYAYDYSGNYSLNEMLQNYNVITFGKKDLDSNMPTTVTRNTTTYPFNKGDVNIFHINGQFLVNGNLNITRFDLQNGKTNLKSEVKDIGVVDMLGYSPAPGGSVGWCGYEPPGQDGPYIGCNATESIIYKLETNYINYYINNTSTGYIRDSYDQDLLK